MELVFSKEPLFPAFDEATKILTQLHYLEVGPHKAGIPLDPDVPVYKLLEDTGVLETHTARDKDTGELIGYSVWIVTPHIHYKTSLTATNDVIFIHPKVRKGLQGYKFLKYTINAIKERGVQRILLHVKPHVDFGPAIERLGGKRLETIYSIIV